jgi:hypothetical protein
MASYRIPGQNQFGDNDGANEGPQGLIQAKFKMDRERYVDAKKARNGMTTELPLWPEARETGDYTVEKDEIVMVEKKSKRKGYSNGYSYGFTTLNNLGAEAKKYFPNDPEAAMHYEMQSKTILGASFDRIDFNEVTGGIPNWHSAISVGGTVSCLAHETLAPGEIVEVVPPNPDEYGKYKGHKGMSGFKATLRFKPFRNETALAQWERIFRQRYHERMQHPMQGKYDPKSQNKAYMELKGEYKMAKTFEDAILFNSLLFLYSMAKDGVIDIPTFLGDYAGAFNPVQPADAETLLYGLALHFGFIDAEVAGVNRDPSIDGGPSNFEKFKEKALSRIFYTDVPDNAKFGIPPLPSSTFASHKMTALQSNSNKKMNLAFSELNSWNKSRIYGRVTRPANAGGTATIYR